MADINTIEEARAEILRLEEANAELTNERDTLLQNNDTLTKELGEVRTLNQQLFLKARAQYSQEPDKTDNDEEEVQSCEDFARTHNIL